MRFQFDQLSGNQRYHLITQTVTPRPIAWIMTRNQNNTLNVAPFSYFTPIDSDPALFMVSIGNKGDGSAKDTKANLLRNKECVLHIASGELVNEVNLSAANLPYGDSEITHADLSVTDFTDTMPRIEKAKVAFHCQLFDLHSLDSSAFDFLYLEIQELYVSDNLITESNQRTYIDNKRLNPLGRLGGNDYTLLGDTVTIKRPN